MEKAEYKNCGPRFYGISIILICMFLAGCSPPVVDQSRWDPFKLIWPFAPEKPRVKYFDTIATSKDVSGSEGFAAAVFGDEEVVGMVKPYGVTVDGQGRVYVTDVGSILVFDKAGKQFFRMGDTGLRRLIRPLGIFYAHKNQLLYVADPAMDRVFAFDQSGEVRLEIGNKGELKDPGGVVVDMERERIYVSNTKAHSISIFDLKGGLIKNLGERGTNEGNFNYPTQMALDKEGRLYVVDSGNFRIQIFGSDEKVIRTLGGVGVQFGQFARPKGIAIAPDGNIFIVDSMFQGVTVFNPDGKLLLAWGAKGNEKGLFDTPAAIHIDDENKIYVVSQLGKRVDIFQYILYPAEKE